MKNLILASSSAFKRRQLEQLGLNFTSIAPDVDESAQAQEKPRELALRLSELKARTVSPHLSNSLVIGCDQSASLGDTFLSKPMSRLRAAEQLTKCSKQVVEFYSALSVVDTETDTAINKVTQTTVRFRDLSPLEIENYLTKEDVRFCAGSFKAEALGISLFDELSSNDPSALIGLPLIALNKILIQLNYNPLLMKP